MGSTLLNSLLSPDIIQSTIQILQTNNPMITKQDKSTLKLIQGALQKLTVFAVSGHAKPILSLNGLNAVIDTFENFKGVYRNKNELNADGIVGCFRMMTEMCSHRDEIEAQLRQQILSSNVISSIVNFVSNNPKDTRTVIEAVRLLNELASFVDIENIVESDVIEAVRCEMDSRTHGLSNAQTKTHTRTYTLKPTTIDRYLHHFDSPKMPSFVRNA